ncbi:MAG: hypothetical protein Q7S65_01975 [Nanoarchaeota archaeon]|nr:hypothetical protein [Nanoarchaeota archaeon]
MKADLPLKTLIEVILFVALFFIGYNVFTALMEWWIGEQIPQETLKSAERVRIEAETLLKEEFSFPVSLDPEHQITLFKDGKGIPGCAPERSCVCVCPLTGSCTSQNARECRETSAKLQEGSIRPHFDAEGRTDVFTCTASTGQGGIEVRC